ncbi:MAG: response regulator transcription factor [Candidatus Promineifilaceae bacterium]
MSGQLILIVDDDKSIVKILRGYIEQAGYKVLSAFDGETALQTLRSERPDLLILDLMLPDRDGWDITRLIRSDKRVSATPIIMLTARVDDTDKIIGLELGADDYITKPFNPREVIARVRALLRRSQLEQNAPAERLTVGDLRLDLGQHTVTLNGQAVEVTPTEFELLKVLMESPGHTFSREELLEKSLGYGYEGFGRTLDTHIRNLRKKIEPDPKNPSYIKTVYSIGYRFTKG